MMSNDVRDLCYKLGSRINDAIQESDHPGEVVDKLRELGFDIDLKLEVTLKRTGGGSTLTTILRMTDDEKKFFSQFEDQLKSGPTP